MDTALAYAGPMLQAMLPKLERMLPNSRPSRAYDDGRVAPRSREMSPRLVVFRRPSERDRRRGSDLRRATRGLG